MSEVTIKKDGNILGTYARTIVNGHRVETAKLHTVRELGLAVVTTFCDGVGMYNEVGPVGIDWHYWACAEVRATKPVLKPGLVTRFFNYLWERGIGN